jgi:hypothetical protein
MRERMMSRVMNFRQLSQQKGDQEAVNLYNQALDQLMSASSDEELRSSLSGTSTSSDPASAS